MHGQIRKLSFLVAAGLLLTACQPAADAIPDADQVATIVAATLSASDADGPDQPTASPEPDSPTGEAANSAYGACANSGTLTVAYVKEADVWLWVQGGEPSQLTDTGDVADLKLSDDGCRVAFVRLIDNANFDPNAETFSDQTYNELWLVNSDGSGAQVLAGADFLSELPAPDASTTMSLYRFDWRPGTHSLAFSTQAAAYGLVLSNDIHLVDANAAEISTLLPGGQGGDFYFSSDGSQVAFSTHQSVGLINTDGSGLQTDLITFPTVITYSEYLYYPPVHWGPDSNDLMVAVPPEDGLAQPANGVYPETDLWYVPLDGTDPWGAGAIQNVWFAQSEVSFAPDVGRIAYLRPVGQPEENRSELVIALSNGSNESLNLEENRITIGAWSPDSSQLLYWYEGADGRPMIYLANAADGSIQPADGLTQFQANVAYFQWLDANAYVQSLYRGADNFIELGLINLDGTGVVIDAYQSNAAVFDVAGP